MELTVPRIRPPTWFVTGILAISLVALLLGAGSASASAASAPGCLVGNIASMSTLPVDSPTGLGVAAANISPPSVHLAPIDAATRDVRSAVGPSLRDAAATLGPPRYHVAFVFAVRKANGSSFTAAQLHGPPVYTLVISRDAAVTPDSTAVLTSANTIIRVDDSRLTHLSGASIGGHQGAFRPTAFGLPRLELMQDSVGPTTYGAIQAPLSAGNGGIEGSPTWQPPLIFMT